MATAIEFDHVGKQYRLGLVSTRTLSHDLNRWWHTAILKQEDPYLRIGEVNDRTTAASHSQYVWALRDIDFKIEQGDVVGIIGKNGAGKSTLLKLLSKVTGPTVGTIRARGRIGALLEVGTGFHPEMTGRENIYMNGAIMGMSKAEITSKLDEIIDFSGCERYIDTPVKRYSSGMTVRLGFAVAAHLDPEILVVDEVLAVGDAEFQKKAIGKMQEVSRSEGRTVLFVSHNMASIRALCKHGILLENGGVKGIGDAGEIIDAYIKDNDSKHETILKEVSWVDDRLRIEEITINGTASYYSNLPLGKDFLDLVIRGSIDGCINTEVTILFKNDDESVLASYSYSTERGTLLQLNGAFVINAKICLPRHIHSGNLIVDVYFHQPNVCFFLKAVKCCIIQCEGFRTPFGQVKRIKSDGFMELGNY